MASRAQGSAAGFRQVILVHGSNGRHRRGVRAGATPARAGRAAAAIALGRQDTPRLLAQAAELIEHAKRPIILAGQGIKHGNAHAFQIAHHQIGIMPRHADMRKPRQIGIRDRHALNRRRQMPQPRPQDQPQPHRRIALARGQPHGGRFDQPAQLLQVAQEFARQSGDHADWDAHLLAHATKLQILTRMMLNVKRA